MSLVRNGIELYWIPGSNCELIELLMAAAACNASLSRMNIMETLKPVFIELDQFRLGPSFIDKGLKQYCYHEHKRRI